MLFLERATLVAQELSSLHAEHHEADLAEEHPKRSTK
jgi:hypothetical protein